MTPPRPKPERLRHWLLPAACLALAPKCVVCAFAYAGLGLSFGLSTPELCGAAPATSSLFGLHLLPFALGALLTAAFLTRRLVTQRRSSASPIL